MMQGQDLRVEVWKSGQQPAEEVLNSHRAIADEPEWNDIVARMMKTRQDCCHIVATSCRFSASTCCWIIASRLRRRGMLVGAAMFGSFYHCAEDEPGTFVWGLILGGKGKMARNSGSEQAYNRFYLEWQRQACHSISYVIESTAITLCCR